MYVAVSHSFILSDFEKERGMQLFSIDVNCPKNGDYVMFQPCKGGSVPRKPVKGASPPPRTQSYKTFYI